METRIYQWTSDLTRVIETGYSKMTLEFVLLFVAVITALIGVAILGMNIAKAGDKYFFLPTSDKKLHYVWMALIIVFAVIEDFYISPVGVVLIFLTLLSGIGSIIFLIKWSKKGVYTSIAYVWILLVANKLISIQPVMADYYGLEKYDIPNQFVLYQMDRMMLLNIIARAVLASCITMFLVVYYSKRYLLFTENRGKLSGVNTCPSCGRPITSLFCPNCGRDLTNYSKSTLGFKTLDKDRYCVKCGEHLLRDGHCPKCVSEELKGLSTKEIIIKTFVDKSKENLLSNIIDKTKSVLFLVFLMFLLIIPHSFPSALSKMLSGSTVIYNTYIEKVMNYRDNPSVSYDEEWMRGFNEAYNALFSKNSAGFYEANPAALMTFDNHAYALYFPYCYYQNQIIDRISSIVSLHESEEIPRLLNALDETTERQQEILLSELNRLKRADRIRIARDMMIDSIRFYIVFIGTPLFTIILFVLGIISMMSGLYISNKNGKKELFLVRKNETMSNNSDLSEGRIYRRKQRSEQIMAILLVLVIGFLSYTVSTLLSKPDNTRNYKNAAQSAYFESGMVMFEWLCIAKNNPDIAQKDTERFLEAVEQWNEMQEIMALPENQEEARNYIELSELNFLIDAELAEVQQALQDGKIPDDKLLTETARNIVNGMYIIQPNAYKQIEESIKEELSD